MAGPSVTEAPLSFLRVAPDEAAIFVGGERGERVTWRVEV